MGHVEQIQHRSEVDQHYQTAVRKANSAVHVQGTVGDWFHTSVGVRQGCLLSPTLFSTLLESIMTDTLGDHHGIVSIGGRVITNIRFADDIDGLVKEQELVNLSNRLDKTSPKYGMEISAEQTTLMTNNTKPIEKKISQELETVNQFKYLGAILSEEVSKILWISSSTLELFSVKRSQRPKSQQERLRQQQHWQNWNQVGRQKHQSINQLKLLHTLVL